MQTERSARANPARGIALIATAIVIGLFVLRNGFDVTTASDAGDGAETPTSQAPPASTGGGGTATTAAAPPRQPAEVTVLVANASGVTGAAAAQSEELAAAGYQTLEPDDAPEQVETTQVLFAPGFDREAATLAGAVGAPDGVAPLPDPSPVELQGAQILVLLGPDLAEPG